MNDFNKNLEDFIQTGHAYLWVKTHEISRVVSDIKKIAEKTKKNFMNWSAGSGWKEGKTSTSTPEAAIKEISETEQNAIIVLNEFGFYLNQDKFNSADVIVSWFHDNQEQLSSTGITVIVIDPCENIPDSLKYNITEVDYPLPDEDIENYIRFVCDGVENEKLEPDEKSLPAIINACRGMTHQQIMDKIALAIRKHKKLDLTCVKTIAGEKAKILKSSGILSYIEPPEGGLNNIGGYDALKRAILLDKPCLTKEAREFGIEPPKGLLLAGVPGVGKSLLSMAIASELELPLVNFDIGACFGSLVGESEKNLRETIKIIDSIGPCVIRIDEVEKSFGRENSLDGGSSNRVLGGFLSWLQDRTSSAYIIFTANNVSLLPPEFCRSGRVDQIWGLGLPAESEREEIFKIHLLKRGRDPKKFDTQRFASITQDFSGSDIEQSIKLGLKIAFQQRKHLETEFVIDAINSTIPLAKTEPDKISAIKEWISKHAKLANPVAENSSKRKVKC
jgi:ATP-dependent 26S proteasome regulatory subunit